MIECPGCGNSYVNQEKDTVSPYFKCYACGMEWADHKILKQNKEKKMLQDAIDTIRAEIGDSHCSVTIQGNDLIKVNAFNTQFIVVGADELQSVLQAVETLSDMEVPK